MVKTYVEGRSSYRNLKRLKSISPPTAFTWVADYGQKCLDAIETTKFFGLTEKNKYSGVLLVDGKWIRIAGQRKVILLAQDAITYDLVNLGLAEGEQTLEYMLFFKDLIQRTNYPLKVLVSDGQWALVNARRRLFPALPWQLCVVHLMRDVDNLLSFPSTRNPLHRALRERTRRILFANSFAQAKRELKVLESNIGWLFDDKQAFQLLKMIKGNFSAVTTHFRKSKILPYKRFTIPRSTNLLEGTISYLNSRFKTMKGFKKEKTACQTLKLITLCFRWKKFTDAKLNFLNGKSPLELSGAKIDYSDWVEFIDKATR